MAAGLDLLLRALEDAASPIGRLPIVPEAERRLLHGCSVGLPREYGFDESLPALFEERARLAPDAPALIRAGVPTTYRELERRSAALARRLIDEGVGSESMVGVCLARSTESVVAILAIWRSGAAYVALDPAYPRARLEYMARDAGLAIVISRSAEWERVQGEEWPVRALLVDAPGEAPGDQPFARADRIRADSLAYVVYTSGSTGEPKGVMGLHGATLNRFRWMWEQLPFEADDKVCLKTSIGFVDSVWETFGGLLRGVPSVLIDESTGGDVHRLVTSSRGSGLRDRPRAISAEIDAGDRANSGGAFPTFEPG